MWCGGLGSGWSLVWWVSQGVARQEETGQSEVWGRRWQGV